MSTRLVLILVVLCSLIFILLPFVLSGLGYAGIDITILYPINNTNYTTASLGLNWTINITFPNWCAYSLDGGVNNTNIFNNSGLCYQETATTATSCGGLNNGIYSCSGDWSVLSPCTNVYDGDWGTFGASNLEPAYLYINYTKPSNILNTSLWRVKDENADYPNGQNFTIFSTCWNQPLLQLRVYSLHLFEVLEHRYDCWDGDSWEPIYDAPGRYMIFEEAMWWNISTPSNTTMTSLSESKHNVTIYCNDTSGNMGQSYYTYFTINQAPQWSNNRTNAGSATYNGTTVQINLTITDITAVNFYTLTHNDTNDGTWINETLVESGSATAYMIWNYTIRNFTDSGGTFGWRVWANDTLGNSNISDIYTFAINNIFNRSFCGNLDRANSIYILVANLTSADTCFNIQANNITLDCKGHTINYSSDGGNAEYGINSDYNFTTVKGCIIKEGIVSGDFDTPVYLSGENGVIENNTITSSGVSAYGILLSSSSNSNVSSNTVTTSGSSGIGIWVYSDSSSNIISTNTITTYGSTGYGIWLNASYLPNTAKNNTITTYGSDGYGIILSVSLGSNLSTNTITTYGSNGYGIWVHLDSTSNSISSNTITTSGSNSDGIVVSLNSNNNSFSGMNIKTSNITAYPFYIFDTSHNFTITDSILNSSYAGIQELYIGGTVTGGVWNFTNITKSNGNNINIGWVAPSKGTLNMKWWLATNVTDGVNPIQANITIYDVNSNLAANLTTDANGYLKQELLEYTNVNNTATTYYSNYTISAARTGYLVNSQSVNMSANRLLSIVFSMPFFSDWQNNASSNTYRYGSVNFSINISDNVGLSSYMFAHNQTGIWSNISNGSISGKSRFLNYTLNITLRKNNYICGQYWANSTTGSVNQTNLSCFIVQNALPLLKTDLQFKNSTAGHNFTVNAEFTDWDNASDFVSKTIENSTGQCKYQSNSTLGDDITLLFNCTGTALQSTTIRINTTDGSGITINSSQLTNVFPNQAPIMAGTELNKTSGVVDTDDLNCSATGKADVDGDATVYHYNWYKNSVAQGYDDARLLNTNSTPGENWYCEAWADDTYANSSKYTSSSVSIGSSQISPVITTLNATTTETGINSTAAYPTNNNSWVNLSIQFTDANNDRWTSYICTTPTWSDCLNNISGVILCKSESNLTDKTITCRYDLSGYTAANPRTFYGFVLDNTSLQSTSTSATFEVNYPPSLPTLVYPSANLHMSTNYTFINWSATDPDSDTINYTLYINSSTYNYTLFYDGTNTYFNFANATAEYETYNWRIYTFDWHGYGYHNITLGNFTTDWTEPTITITQPVGTKSSRVNILARWNVTDFSPLSNCRYSVGRTGTEDEIANTSISCSTNSVNLTVTLDADFDFYLTAIDSAGNIQVVSSSFSVDTSSPPPPPPSGGGLKQIKESQIVEPPPLVELPSLCGDGVCDEGESPWDCPRDCFKKVFNFNDIFCLPLGRCGNWEESWFINILVLLTLSFLAYFMFLRKPGRLR